ncbi:MAG: TonB-dependent receptor [Capnocytophaga sp.]|nr:TonB-dependent receptor [Capnocytophaga sp.]
MLRKFIGVFFFFFTFMGFAQHSISGVITDCKTGAPIANATIENQTFKTNIKTNTQGNFTINNLPIGEYIFFVSQENYKGNMFKISLKKDIKNYTFSLCPNKEITIDEIVVTATKVQKSLKNVPITVQVVTAEDIRKSEATDFQSFLETEFSGINFTYNGGSPNINMMGFNGKYVLFLMDGERMAGEAFDNIDYDRIDLDNIERIEVIKGAASSLYGSNAIGGVINIITKNPQKPLDVNVGYLYDQNEEQKYNLSVGTRQKWGSVSVASFYKNREPYILTDKEPLKTKYSNGTETSEPLGEMNVAGFTNYGVTPKIKINITPKIDVNLTPSYYFNERNDGTVSSEKVRDRYYNYNLSMKTNIGFADESNLSISGAYDRYDKFKYYRLLEESDKTYENAIWRGGAQYNKNFFGKNASVLGGEILSDELLDWRFEEDRSFSKRNVKTYSFFAQQDLALSDDFSLVAGVRYDYHSKFKGFTTFRLSGMYKIEHFTLRGGYSSGFRSPTLKELYSNWFHPWGGGFQIIGNQDLKPETSDNFNFSVDYNSQKWDFTAITQFSKVTNKITNLWIAGQSGQRNSYKNINDEGISNILSSDISFTYRPSRAFRLKGSYAYYFLDRRRSENRPHTFTFKAEYMPKRDALYIPNIVLSAKYLSATNIYGTDNGLETHTYYEPYSIWRLQLSSKLPFHFRISAGINNIFDYITNTTSFYTSISPGRTYYIGLKWTY